MAKWIITWMSRGSVVPHKVVGEYLILTGPQLRCLVLTWKYCSGLKNVSCLYRIVWPWQEAWQHRSRWVTTREREWLWPNWPWRTSTAPSLHSMRRGRWGRCLLWLFPFKAPVICFCFLILESWLLPLWKNLNNRPSSYGGILNGSSRNPTTEGFVTIQCLEMY